MLSYGRELGGSIMPIPLPMSNRRNDRGDAWHNHAHTTARYAHLANDLLKSAANRIASRIAEVTG